jgi:iron complex transport system substrate-binding protein
LSDVVLVSLLGGLIAAAPQWLGPEPPSAIRRVVTLAPSLTETVLALGAAQLLVGVTRFDEAAEVAALPRVGGFTEFSLEAVLALKPDLVLVQMAPGNRRPVEALGGLGVPVAAMPLTSSQDALDAIETVGRLLGRQARALQLRGAFQTARARWRHAAERRTSQRRVLLVYGFSPLIVAGPGSFAHELLQDCGALNIAQDAATAYPAYSLERAVTLAPEVVIDAADTEQGRMQVRALPQLARARWMAMPTKDLLHPGPALARALDVLCVAVNGPETPADASTSR